MQVVQCAIIITENDYNFDVKPSLRHIGNFGF